MPYRVEVSTTAERQIRALDRNDQIRVLRAVSALAVDPRPRGCRKLSGHSDVFRIRIGVYRALYAIEGKRLVVVVLKVGHRRDVYR